MQIIDKYIIKKYLTTFVFTMGVFAVIIPVFDISERLDDFLKHNAPIEKIVFEYYAGFIPFYLNMLSPLVNFIAVIFFTARMADKTEIVPILSGGMSFLRFLKPYMIAASVIFVVSLAFNVFIIPETNKLLNNFRDVYIDPRYDNSKNMVHMRLNDSTYVFVRSFDNTHKVGYNFVMEKFDDLKLKEKLVADRILWDSVNASWKIENYSVRIIDSLNEKMTSATTLDTVLDMQPGDFDIYVDAFGAMSTPELYERIEKEEIRGTGIMVNLQIEKYKRYVTPLSAFILTLMGVALSSRKVRGGLGLSLGMGIGLSFTYLVLSQFSTIFALQGGWPPMLAIMTPNILYAVIAVLLIARAPK